MALSLSLSLSRCCLPESLGSWLGFCKRRSNAYLHNPLTSLCLVPSISGSVGSP